jgi:hypothetical protein
MDHEVLFRKSLYDISGENQKVLYFINKEINILENFSHIIKKKNLEIYVIISDKKMYLNMINKAIGEELDDKIFIHQNIEDINLLYNDENNDTINHIFNYINIFDLSCIKNLELILKDVYNLINNDTSICIYCTMSNESDKNIDYKNFIREIINSSICNVSTVIKLSDFLKLFNNNKEYIISCMNIYKKNNYIIYGDNTIYSIIINKKIT